MNKIETPDTTAIEIATSIDRKTNYRFSKSKSIEEAEDIFLDAQNKRGLPGRKALWDEYRDTLLSEFAVPVETVIESFAKELEKAKTIEDVDRALRKRSLYDVQYSSYKDTRIAEMYRTRIKEIEEIEEGREREERIREERIEEQLEKLMREEEKSKREAEKKRAEEMAKYQKYIVEQQKKIQRLEKTRPRLIPKSEEVLDRIVERSEKAIELTEKEKKTEAYVERLATDLEKGIVKGKLKPEKELEMIS